MSQKSKDRLFATLITLVTIFATMASLLILQSLGILIDAWQALIIAVIFITLGSVVWIHYRSNQLKNI
jgi:hypothetical protein